MAINVWRNADGSVDRVTWVVNGKELTKEEMDRLEALFGNIE